MGMRGGVIESRELSDTWHAGKKGWKERHCLVGWGRSVLVYKCILQTLGCLLTDFVISLMDQNPHEGNYSGRGNLQSVK